MKFLVIKSLRPEVCMCIYKIWTISENQGRFVVRESPASAVLQGLPFPKENFPIKLQGSFSITINKKLLVMNSSRAPHHSCVFPLLWMSLCNFKMKLIGCSGTRNECATSCRRCETDKEASAHISLLYTPSYHLVRTTRITYWTKILCFTVLGPCSRDETS